ncbi:triose-phosphate transporter family-domain-containing protein [Pelagophyceae sp. CCMP2097]|nr:triose-phosphate transporter family-domain-containing protein [Pelagophyceae sp. CCMP2097]
MVAYRALCVALLGAVAAAKPVAPKRRVALAPVKPAPTAEHDLAAVALRQRGGRNAVVQRLEVGAFFGAWYALNVYYNIENKKVLQLVGLPWTVSVFQLAVGAVYSLLAWALRFRAAPTDLVAALKAAWPIAVAHGAGQACTVISLGAGKVSATHVVKALEPLFSAVGSAVVLGAVLPAKVYGALLLVVGGVAVAVAKDLTFSPLSFSAAMASNALFATRAIVSKQAMKTGALAGLSAPTLFGVVTIGAALATAPFALAFEGGAVRSAVAGCVAPPSKLAVSLALSGLFHYLNNEVMYMTLSRVSPVTLAIGNTVKRVVIIVASLLVFQEPMAPASALGASVALVGVLLYSLLLKS